MTNVSKRKLSKKQQTELFQQFAKFASLGSDQQTKKFLTEIFTESEEVMIIKRLAAILLLSKNVTPYRVSQTLKMSESTVNRFRLKLDIGEFEAIVKISRRKNFDSESFWDTLDSMLRLGMPSMGRDRWKALKRM